MTTKMPLLSRLYIYVVDGSASFFGNPVDWIDSVLTVGGGSWWASPGSWIQ